MDRGLTRLVDGPLDRGLRIATDHPGIVLAASTAAIVLALTLVSSGFIRVEFLPQVEGDVIAANFELPTGTPGERTAEVGARLEAAGHTAAARLSEGRREGDVSPRWNTSVTVGESAELYNPLRGDRTTPPRGHVGAVQFALPDVGGDVTASDFERAWREEAGTLPGVKSLVFSSGALELALPVHMELFHPDPVTLNRIAEEFVAELGNVDGVFGIRSDRDDGFRELQLELKPQARTLGLTLDDLARQVRSAFFGSEALRVLRGREDMRVYVRLPEEERNSVADIERYVVRTAGGSEVPLGQVATAHFTRSSTAIHTVDGQRVIAVTASVDSRVANAQQVNVALESEILEPLAAEHPGFSYAFGGEQRQQRQTVEALSGSLIIVFMIMFALLAIPFGSYSQPLIVMAAIPLGFVGAILGHLLLGLSFGFMSIQGLVGCFGVVVNDSLVMINFINEKRDGGLEIRDAIIVGTKARVRAILLTSVTTFLGVAPLVFETDPAAQHLVPVAAALAFGVLVATPLLMLVIPALMMSQANLGARLRPRFARKGPGLQSGQPI